MSIHTKPYQKNFKFVLIKKYISEKKIYSKSTSP